MSGETQQMTADASIQGTNGSVNQNYVNHMLGPSQSPDLNATEACG